MISCAGMVALTASRASQAEPLAFVPPVRSVESETATKVASPFTVAAVGDLIMPQPLYSDDPAFQRLIEPMRKADVGFANMESSLVDFRHFDGPVAGTEAPIEMGASIKAMGVTLVTHANNHALDGGVAGMISTDQALDQLGIVHAGTGRDLQEARAARFLATPKGRVAAVGMFSLDDASNYGPSYSRTEATYRNGDLGGAPGVNPLHLTAYHVVKPEQLDALRAMAQAIYGAPGGRPPAVVGTPDRMRFFDEWYEAGADAGAIRYEMNPADERDILQSIRNGKVYGDFLIASIHVHQTSRFCAACLLTTAGVPGMKEGLDHDAPDFLVKLAHDSIDNGADMFVAHGVHALRGVEIYKGKPIFYGLSNFVFQFGLQFGSGNDVLANERNLSALENPASQEALLATSRFENGKLVEVRLYPAALGGPQRPISRMGIPLTPAPQEAQRILKGMQDYSSSFGTRIAIENGVGVIRP
jgi:poly-gamma-glutamate synthesis protein (capsule biosynthesis protein)